MQLLSRAGLCPAQDILLRTESRGLGRVFAARGSRPAQAPGGRLRPSLDTVTVRDHPSLEGLEWGSARCATAKKENL
jgi:hypothetical protein